MDGDLTHLFEFQWITQLVWNCLMLYPDWFAIVAKKKLSGTQVVFARLFFRQNKCLRENIFSRKNIACLAFSKEPGRLLNPY
jgi:hypothetical protein